VWVNLIELVRLNPPTKREVKQGLEFERRHAKVRFYADENFPPVATRLLRKMGAIVVTAQDKGLKGHPDENHLSYALKHGYVLVTCDRDFLDDRKFPLVHAPALVVFDFGSGTVKEIRQSFNCLRTIQRIPQFYDKWTKIDAKRDSWTEQCRFLDGSKSRSRYRIYKGRMQQWVERES
jgi:predicted nuclease of predicted toxin-antitoxin system